MNDLPHSQSPLVTVIVPTFNRREWIGECLDSVLAQTYQNIEIIVVDDGSSDGTAEWIKSQPSFSGIQLHVQPNQGASVARNNGIALAKGDLIAFIDSDDLLLPAHVETAVKKFEEEAELGLFCCDSMMIDAHGHELFGGKTWHTALSEAKGVEVKSGFRKLEDVFAFSNCFPGFTLRREVFEKLGGFDQSIFPADDYDLALRVAGSDYRVFYQHETLCLRREHDGQLSGIRNSVKTQVQLIRALERASESHPGRTGPEDRVARRIGDVRLELGMSQLKEGAHLPGVKTILSSVASSPSQLRTLSRIGFRRLRKVFALN